MLDLIVNMDKKDWMCFIGGMIALPIFVGVIMYFTWVIGLIVNG